MANRDMTRSLRQSGLFDRKFRESKKALPLEEEAKSSFTSAGKSGQECRESIACSSAMPPYGFCRDSRFETPG